MRRRRIVSRAGNVLDVVLTVDHCSMAEQHNHQQKDDATKYPTDVTCTGGQRRCRCPPPPPTRLSWRWCCYCSDVVVVGSCSRERFVVVAVGWFVVGFSSFCCQLQLLVLLMMIMIMYGRRDDA
jgi:hypothetical protein